MMAPGVLVNMKKTIELSVDAVQIGRFFHQNIKTFKHFDISDLILLIL